MRSVRFLGIVFIISVLAGFPLLADWPEFRGPSGQGLADAAPPLRWSETENVVWKTAVPGLGWSSPTLRDGLIWLTSAAEEGRSLRTIAVEASSGDVVRNVEVFRLDRSPPIHQKNSHASPTPILEDDRVYVHFGPQGTAALNAQGEILWRNTEHVYRPGHGSGGSPALWRDLLILSCDGTDRQYVVALDKATGETVWRRPRARGRMAFTTPLVIEPEEGPPQVVSPGGDLAVAYNLRTGEELWWIRYNGFSLVPRPVFAHGLVYLTSGFYRPILFAVRPGGRGDVTDSRVVWREQRGVPLTPSPIVVGDELYMVNDNGIAACLDARDGETLWRERLGGGFSASPVAAAGRIYFTNESGETTVLRAGRSFERLAKNQIDGRTLASLAIDQATIYLRSASHIYRIGE